MDKTGIRMSMAAICTAVAAVSHMACGSIMREDAVYSAIMNKDVPASVILPDSYAVPYSTNRYPVVYILHGAGGSHRRYIDAKIGLPELADRYQAILVCADGGKTSWWFDSPVDPSVRYETHVSKELVQWIDSRYRTIPERGKRAVMGASMGGHGACWIGFRHKDVFGAVGVIVGGVDLWDFPDSWDIAKCLGPRDEFPERWREHSAVAEAAKLKNGDVEIVSVVGTSDFFLEPNRKLHRIMSDNKVAHTYIEIRGKDDKSSGHDFSFSRNSSCWSVVVAFFRSYFDTGTGRLVCGNIRKTGGDETCK